MIVLTGNVTFLLLGDLFEGVDREVEVVLVAARGACIGNNDRNTLAVVGVGELDPAATV